MYKMYFNELWIENLLTQLSSNHCYDMEMEKRGYLKFFPSPSFSLSLPFYALVHSKSGVKLEYEAFSQVSAGNFAMPPPRMC